MFDQLVVMPLISAHPLLLLSLLCIPVHQGEMKVIEAGSDVYDSLDKAVASLEKKLHKYGKAAPFKKDYSRR